MLRSVNLPLCQRIAIVRSGLVGNDCAANNNVDWLHRTESILHGVWGDRTSPNYDPSILSILFVMFLCCLASDCTLFYRRKCFLALSDLSGLTVIRNSARIIRKYHCLNRVVKKFISSSISTNPSTTFEFWYLVALIRLLLIQVLELMTAH